MTATLIRKCHPIDGSTITDADELLSAALKHLSHTISDDSFDYEYGDARGTCEQHHAELDQVVLRVEYPDDCEVVPFRCDGTYKAGGCSGEHRGRCESCCTEVEIGFRLQLDDIERKENGKWLATYDVVQE